MLFAFLKDQSSRQQIEIDLIPVNFIATCRLKTAFHSLPLISHLESFLWIRIFLNKCLNAEEAESISWGSFCLSSVIEGVLQDLVQQRRKEKMHKQKRVDFKNKQNNQPTPNQAANWEFILKSLSRKAWQLRQRKERESHCWQKGRD